MGVQLACAGWNLLVPPSESVSALCTVTNGYERTLPEHKCNHMQLQLHTCLSRPHRSAVLLLAALQAQCVYVLEHSDRCQDQQLW
jgi:hypothetical protein